MLTRREEVGAVVRPASSTVSVDVLALRYDPVARRVSIAVTERVAEPFKGQLALPGVVLWEGERLADAGRRAAATKLGVPLLAIGQLTAFDEPTRDPRGATLSIALWGVAIESASDKAQWFSLDDLPPLAFDHTAIVEVCRPLLAERLWRDTEFTRALTGEQFPVSAAVALTKSLSGVTPDRGNLNRKLASVRGLEVSHRKVVLGRGRPGTLWEWLDDPADA